GGAVVETACLFCWPFFEPEFGFGPACLRFFERLFCRVLRVVHGGCADIPVFHQRPCAGLLPPFLGRAFGQLVLRLAVREKALIDEGFRLLARPHGHVEHGGGVLGVVG